MRGRARVGVIDRVEAVPRQAPPDANRRADVQQSDTMLYGLVAHHSYATVEAEERRLAGVLALEFELTPEVLSSVLTCCDMTTSPDGEPVPVGKRLAEIHCRYGSGYLVTRSIGAPHR